MSRIQSKNIATLCSELGFGEDIGGRETKALTNAITDFRGAFVKQGHQLPYSTPDSPEARFFAFEFCQENNRGETLWPSIPNSPWPSWSIDRSKILTSLAHIFALQAYYKYQSDLKVGKKRMSSATPASVTGGNTRELSPESQKYVGPTPPSGTRRRPAKKPQSVVDLDAAAPKGNIDELCVEEVDLLDPRNDDKPIEEFTPQWLSKPGARWPMAADLRLKTFMHTHNFYNPEDADVKLLPLITALRKGTEIETGEAKQFNILKPRILERVSCLSRELCSKGLLRMESGIPQKGPEFKAVWNNRNSYWGPKGGAAKSSPKSKKVDIFDMDSLPPDDADRRSAFKSPTAKMMSKGIQQSLSTKSMDSPTSVTRRKLDSSNEVDVQNEHQQKKRKMNAMEADTQALATPPHGHSSASSSVNAVDDALIEDPITTENVNFAQEYLSSNSVPEPQQPSEAIPKMQSMAKETRPLTPTSPVVTSTRSDRENRTPVTPGRFAPSPSFNTSSNVPPSSPGFGGTRTTPVPQVASHQPLSTDQRIVLVLEKADGGFDEDDPLPSTHLRNSNVYEFFSLVAKTANKPLESVHTLTFTFIFAPGTILVVHKGDEAAWNKLKRKALFLFTLYRTRLDETEFQLVVEIGDKKNTVTAVSAMWGA